MCWSSSGRVVSRSVVLLCRHFDALEAQSVLATRVGLKSRFSATLPGKICAQTAHRTTHHGLSNTHRRGETLRSGKTGELKRHEADGHHVWKRTSCSSM